MSSIDRRSFISRAARFGVGAVLAPSLAGLSEWSSVDLRMARSLRPRNNGGFGPLVQSTECPELWIPQGFRCVRLSRSRQPSAADPSFTVPNAMDGMATFALPNGDIRLIRNHEMGNPAARAQPLGERPYDARASGGTTSLTVRVTGSGQQRTVSVVEEYVSLSGTHVNCAGGLTPWGSWLSCEETTAGTSQGFEKPHGYIFEVPVAARGPVDPVPLRAMGRFVHEAIAVDPRSSIVYETEDVRRNASNPEAQPGSGFYRFIPTTPQRLADGGRLQVLAVRGNERMNLTTNQRVGVSLPVRWLDIADPDPAAAERDSSSVFREAHTRGAASFDRLEGCFWADDSCYFVSTNGGTARAGQVWRYVPEGADGGSLSLVFESPSRAVLDAPDNICVSSRGGVIICEDGSAEQYVRALNRTGEMIDLVLQPQIAGESDPTEFAGSCYSPDGEILFFNVQGSTTSYGTRSGSTYALWGEWGIGYGV